MKKKFFTVKMLPLAFMAISLQNCNNATEKTDNKDKNTKQEENAKTGNFENFDVEKQVYEFDTSQEKNILTETGTKIKFVADNFVDKNGKPIKGKVKITLREFHSLADIMASGIPMQYDSAGVKHNFESAGMFELRGTQNNEEIFIAKDKPVKLDLASYKNGAFNQYILAETKLKTAQIKRQAPQHNWLIPSAYAQEMPQLMVNRIDGKWKITMKSQLPTANAEKAKKIAELETQLPKQPVKPQAYNANEPILDFNISNLKEFPELATFQNIVWQYGGEKDSTQDPAKNEWIFSTTWSEVKLQSQNLPGAGISYKLVLKNVSKDFTTQIIPALRGTQLETAKQLFEQKNKEYEAEMKKSSAEREKISQELEKTKLQGDFVRGFILQDFGIFNSDIVGSYQEPILVNANFGGLKISKLFLMVGKRMMVDLGHVPATSATFTFDNRQENQLFATVKDEKGKQKIYRFSKKSFKELDIANIKKTKKADIALEAVAVDNMKQLRELM